MCTGALCFPCQKDALVEAETVRSHDLPEPYGSDLCRRWICTYRPAGAVIRYPFHHHADPRRRPLMTGDKLELQ